ncbi:kelch-like protein 24 [Branchiostoma floridae x Branchiostoma japonicum]
MFRGCNFDDDDVYYYDVYNDRYVNRRSDREPPEDGSCRFENYAQGREILAELSRQRKTGEFLDVVLQVEDEEFPCHRAVLASSPYFKAMLSSNLTDSSSRVVHLRGTDSASFSKILDFLYTGEICMSKDDFQDILQTAHMLQFDKILQYCEKFIQDNLCPTNCLGAMRLGDMYGLSALKISARTMAVSNFSDVTQDEEFLSLSVQEFLDLLGDEDLKVTNEDDVVTSVIRWLEHDHAHDDRQLATLKILQEIRLSCVRVSVLQELESHPVIRESAECLAKITAAREKHLHGTWAEGEKASSPRRGMSDNLAIIAGGWKAVTEQPTPLQGIICLDPDNQQYYHVTSLPTPVSGYMSVASAEGYLYVTGGRVQPLIDQGPHIEPSRQAFRYHFPSDSWLSLPDMPRGRAGHQSVVVDGKLFLVGGGTEATSMVTMDCYDPEEGDWKKVHLPTTIHSYSSSDLKVTTFRDKVVFINANMSDDVLCVHAFDVKANSWIEDCAEMDYIDVVDINTIAVNEKLHIRIRYKKSQGYEHGSNLYIFDAEKEVLHFGYKEDVEENFLRAQCEYSHRYTTGKDTVDTINKYEFAPGQDRYRPAKKTPLPFALLGHSFLETQKSRIRWYCRNLATLESNVESSD